MTTGTGRRWSVAVVGSAGPDFASRPVGGELAGQVLDRVGHLLDGGRAEAEERSERSLVDIVSL